MSIDNRWIGVSIIVVLMVITQAAMNGLIPMIVGFVSLGVMTGLAIFITYTTSDIPRVKTEVKEKIQKEIVPYDAWPNECYVCGDGIDEDVEIRGQFVVHKGNSATKTKAVPLCNECTWTHSTLIDNHDTLVRVYDERENPTDL